MNKRLLSLLLVGLIAGNMVSTKMYGAKNPDVPANPPVAPVIIPPANQPSAPSTISETVSKIAIIGGIPALLVGTYYSYRKGLISKENFDLILKNVQAKIESMKKSFSSARNVLHKISVLISQMKEAVATQTTKALNKMGEMKNTVVTQSAKAITAIKNVMPKKQSSGASKEESVSFIRKAIDKIINGAFRVKTYVGGFFHTAPKEVVKPSFLKTMGNAASSIMTCARSFLPSGK